MMNTLGYLLVIAVLVVLAGLMLYARFSGNAREKALHHSPTGFLPVSDPVSFSQMPSGFADWSPVESESGTTEAAFVIPEPDGTPEAEPVLKLDRSSVETRNDAAEARSFERDYIDELQEAAAGLAKLMRSSPVVRPEPVVFAPGADAPGAAAPGVEDEFAGEESGKDAAPECDTPELISEEEVESTEFSPGVLAEPDEGIVLGLPAPGEEVAIRPTPTTRELLGETVFAKIGEIDEALDALESLVESMSTGLRLLRETDWGIEPGSDLQTTTAGMSEAA